MRHLLVVLSLFSSFGAGASAEIGGQIVRRHGVDYLTAAPGKAVAEYAIRWRSSAAHGQICYADVDKLCPAYMVFYSRLENSPSGAVLIDATSILAPSDSK